MMRRTTFLVGALVLQAGLVAAVSAPRLSPRLTGDEYRVRVQPVDPIDPFRGAYVDLDYDIGTGFGDRSGPEGDVWVEIRGGRLRAPVAERPDGPAVRCHNDDGRPECGIESFFASQDEAKRLERVLAEGAIARIKVDGGGRAAVVAIEPR